MNLKTTSGAVVEVSNNAFGREFNEALVHQVVVAYMAAGRQGSKAQKTRSEVRGGGKKPWRQKGTGRARAGTIRSPIWVGGGRAFAAKPRDHGKKVNRKMYRAAMQSILSELVRQERLLVVDDFVLAEPKTKAAKAALGELGVSNALIIKDSIDESTYLGCRNLPHIGLMHADSIDPVSLIHFDKVVMTVAALKKLEECYS